MKKIFYFIIVLGLSGCSSSALVESFEEDYECYRSAKILDGGENITSGKIDIDSISSPSAIIYSKMNRKYGADATPSETEEMKSIVYNLDEFYRDLEYNPNGGYKAIFYPIKIYNSESCLAMHEHEKIDLPIEISFLYYFYYIFLWAYPSGTI